MDQKAVAAEGDRERAIVPAVARTRAANLVGFDDVAGELAGGSLKVKRTGVHGRFVRLPI
jgi:hypothetical protein